MGRRESKKEAFGKLLDVMDRLREECPWDREQTIHSLRNHTIEELYELIDAIANEDIEAFKEELGDVMFHLVFYAKIAEQKGWFDIEEAINMLNEKQIYRHPHVFGNKSVESAKEVEKNWEQLKLKQKKRKSGTLSGVPKGLPALIKAYRIGEKAAAAGFDWEKREDVWAKVKEEIGEVETEMRAGEGDKIALEEEFGDVMFAMVNAARLYGIDPDAALERCNKKFIYRFEQVEAEAVKRGKAVKDFSLNELEEWWQRAKS